MTAGDQPGLGLADVGRASPATTNDAGLARLGDTTGSGGLTVGKPSLPTVPPMAMSALAGNETRIQLLTSSQTTTQAPCADPVMQLRLLSMTSNEQRNGDEKVPRGRGVVPRRA